MPLAVSKDTLTPHEDLDRESDGVPHSVVGLTALFAVMLAGLVAVIFVTGTGVARFGGLLLAVLAVLALPVLVSTLRKKSDRQRDRVHPSR